MKKVIVFAAMLLVSMSMFAQVRVGAGYLNNNVATKSGNSTTNSVLNGAYAGVSYSIPVSGDIYVTPGAFYSFLTGEQAIVSTAKTKTTRHDVNIPVLVGYSTDLGGVRVSVNAGPMFTCGLKATSNASANIAGINISSGDIDLFKDADYNRFDVKALANAGFYFGTLGVNVGYAYGFLNQIDNSNVTVNSNYAYAGISLAF